MIAKPNNRVQWTVLTATAQQRSSVMVYVAIVVVCINRTATNACPLGYLQTQISNSTTGIQYNVGVTVSVFVAVRVGVGLGVIDGGTGVKVAEGGISVGGTLVEVTGSVTDGCVQSVYPTVLPLPTGYDTPQASNP